MNRKFLAGTFCLSALVGTTFIGAEPASAFSWDVTNREWVTIHDGDEGVSFDVFFYDATIEGQNVQGLNATARFTLAEAFNASTNKAKFKIDLTNTSDTNLWSSARLSGISFGVDPDLKRATASGIFNRARLDGTYPEGVKQVDVCFNQGGNSCSGGGNGGLNLGETGTFYTTLPFDQLEDTSFDINLDQFYARWQSLTSKEDNALGYAYNGDSGVGYGQVPTPALVPGLIGAGMAALRRKQKEADQEAVNQAV